FRHALSRARALHHRRGRRVWLASGPPPAVPGGFARQRRAHPPRGHAEVRRDLWCRAAARAARIEGSTLLRRIPRLVQRAFGARRGQYAARRAMPPALVLRFARAPAEDDGADAADAG